MTQKVKSGKERIFFKKTNEEGKVLTQTPVLRRTKNESEADFLKRMAKIGYADLDKIEKHFSDDGMALHAGSSESCKACRKSKNNAEKLSKKEALIEADSAVPPKAEEAKPQGKVKESAKVDQKSKEFLQKVDDIEEKSEHVIGNAEATKIALKGEGPKDMVDEMLSEKNSKKAKVKTKRRGRPKGSKNKPKQ